MSSEMLQTEIIFSLFRQNLYRSLSVFRAVRIFGGFSPVVRHNERAWGQSSDSTIRAYSLPNLIEVRLAASLQVRWNILRKKNAEPAITVCRPMRAGLAIWIAFVRDITGKAGNGPHSVRQACGMV